MTNIAEYKDNNDNNEIEWQNKKRKNAYARN